MFDSCHTAFTYEPPISRLVTRFKYHGNFADGKVLSILLNEKFESYYRNQEREKSPSSKPQMLIPVPLHPSRLRQRGFNQALEIARTLSKGSGIPIAQSLLTRARKTPPQSQLSAIKRSANMNRAFRLNSSFNKPIPNCVAIVDDVVTTATTVNAIAAQLKSWGVKKIDIWAIARAKLS
jgi:ComF family protein